MLITGETGVGKEVAARYIHDESGSERGGEFVAVNCGSVQENLMDSELFGYMKGAFTDADRDKVGLIEIADGGTLFLDEVEEINHAMQVKLLRVIEEKEYRRGVLFISTSSQVRISYSFTDYSLLHHSFMSLDILQLVITLGLSMAISVLGFICTSWCSMRM